jgi:hypothetical protein
MVAASEQRRRPMTQKPDTDAGVAQDQAHLDPPTIAADYPVETGRELAAESHYEQVHPEPVDHTPGEHPEMPFERAADYPAAPGEELSHRHE